MRASSIRRVRQAGTCPRSTAGCADHRRHPGNRRVVWIHRGLAEVIIESVEPSEDGMWIIVSGPAPSTPSRATTPLWRKIGYPKVEILHSGEAALRRLPFPEPLEKIGILPDDPLSGGRAQSDALSFRPDAPPRSGNPPGRGHRSAARYACRHPPSASGLRGVRTGFRIPECSSRISKAFALTGSRWAPFAIWMFLWRKLRNISKTSRKKRGSLVPLSEPLEGRARPGPPPNDRIPGQSRIFALQT